MIRARALFLGSVVLMLLLLALSCSLLLRDEAGAGGGWYIKLQIQAPAGSKGIAVTDFNVTALKIQVRDPAGEVLQAIDWAAAEGPQTYLVPVKQLGEHQIQVTHFGERAGEQVQATESAAFYIQAMKITVIDVVPGGIGLIRVHAQDVSIDLTGYWDMLIYQENQPPFGPLSMCLKQTGSQLDAQFGGGGLCPGSFDGENVIFQGKPGGDEGMEVAFSGKVEGEQIRGVATVPEATAAFCMTRSTLPFGHWDIDGSYQGLPIHLNSDYAAATKDDDPGPVNFILHYWDTELGAGLWFYVVGEDLEAGRTYSIPGEAWGSLHWSPNSEEFEREDIVLDGPGTLHISSCSAEGIAGTYSASLQGGGSISGSFDVSFVEDW